MSFTNSLSTRIFALIAFLVIATVAGTTIQTSSQFKKILLDATKADLEASSTSATQQIRSTLNAWVASLRILIEATNQAASQTPIQQQAINSFLGNNRDFVALHIHQHDGSSGVLTKTAGYVTSRLDDSRFEGKAQEQSFKEIDQSVTDSVQRHKSSFTESLLTRASGTDIPLVHMHLRYKSSAQDIALIVTLTAWNTNLASSFPSNEKSTSFLINAQGDVLVTTAASSRHGNAAGHPIFRRATARNAPGSGLLERYLGDSDMEMIGAYGFIPDFRLIVISEQDLDTALSFVNQSFKRSILYGALFLLIGLLLTYLAVTTTTRQLVEVTAATQKIAAGNFSINIPMRSKDEVGLLSASVTYMARRIIYLLHAQVESARTQKELETARMVQSTFFPRGDFSSSELAISGFYQPASECGGDLWGSFKVGGNRHAVFMADAMGHGVPAALVTAMAYSAYKMLEALLFEHDILNDSPGRLLEKLNLMIYDALGGKIHMTFYLCVINLERQTLTVANAGHNIPVLIPMMPDDLRLTANRRKKAKQDKDSSVGRNFLPLQASGSPLGLVPDAAYKEKTFDLRVGDKIFLFTDGLIECTNPAGDSWGRKTLLEKIDNFATTNAGGLTQSIASDAFTFFGKHPLKDDITLASVEILGFKSSREQVPPPPVPPPRIMSLPHAGSESTAYASESAVPELIRREDMQPMPEITLAGMPFETLGRTSSEFVDFNMTLEAPDFMDTSAVGMVELSINIETPEQSSGVEASFSESAAAGSRPAMKKAVEIMQSGASPRQMQAPAPGKQPPSKTAPGRRPASTPPTHLPSAAQTKKSAR